MRFSVLGEFFGGFAVLDDFFFGFAVSNTPQCPPLYKYYQESFEVFFVSVETVAS